MSRVSSKSSLSPSATRGSSAIDLGKDSGVDMGRKSEPSVSSGGIGVTREVANIGGMSVTGGVSVDVSPVRLDISGNPNYEDPSKSSISIAGSAEIPGGIVGVGGGVTINTSTGQIEGGSIGGEVVGIGIDISKSSEGVGMGISLQIPGTPISIHLGFEFPDKKEPTPTPTPTPAPTPTPKPGDFSPIIPVGMNSTDYCMVLVDEFMTQSGQHREPATGKLIRTYNNGATASLTIKNKPDKIISLNALIPLVTGTVKSFVNEDVLAAYSIGLENCTNTPMGKMNYEASLKPNYYQAGYYPGGSVGYPMTPDKQITASGFGGLTCITASGREIGNANFFSGFAWGLGIFGIFFLGTENAIGRYIADVNTTLANQAKAEFDRSGNTSFRQWVVSDIIKVSNPLPLPALPPPNPPPRKEMDECCRESIKLMRQIHKRLGISKFPGELPSTIIQTVEKGQQPAEPPQEKIEDFADLLMWMFQRDDERWGQWQIQIDVKDSDLTKEGDQGKQIRFPNLAESIAEMEGQILSLQANVEALVALSTRNLCESGMGRQEAIKAYLASMAIAKYMNFPYEEADIEVPSTFTPKAESIDELIKESTIHVKGVEYNAKESQRDIFLDLLQAAAITRAVHWRQVDPKKDIKSQILESIKGSADLSEKLENPLAKDDPSKPSKPKHVKDWEDFLDQVEDGFGFEAGIEDAQTPYGRSRDRRPRIRQIGENIGQAGKGNG